MARIYLDHAATTPPCAEAVQAMEAATDRFGNPSSLHAEGRAAKELLDQARETLSDRLGCLFAEVCFTSSGTEAAHLAIVGAALANHNPARRRVLLGAGEHHCVLETAPLLHRLGYEVELLPVDRHARLIPFEIGPDVLLVAAMHANNELGTILDIPALAEHVHAAGALLYCDAVQTFLSLEWHVDDLGADLIGLCAHKVYGPKGVGALYVRAGTPLQAVTAGGGQERELRAGTENVAGIAGFAAAINAWDPGGEARRRAARDAFLDRLGSGFALSSEGPTLGGHAHLRFPGLNAESLLIVLDRLGISAGSGAACSSGSIEPSHVLLACGYTEAEAREGLRFTFGHSSTVEEAHAAADRVREAVRTVARR